MSEPRTLETQLRLPCGVNLPNRLFKSAMTEGLAAPLGEPTDAHQRLYRTWSEGGTGTLVTGNVMVDARYLERPGNVIVEDERDLEALTAWARAGTSNSNQLWMQINHPGRQCSRSVTTEPVAPSPVQLRLGGLFARPRALTADEIEDIIARFGRTAAVAKQAGCTGVQVHAAHGYLISQFLSPKINRRQDAWGGSLENRARLLRRIVRHVREVVGAAYPVAVKLNSSDFQRGGFTHEDALQVGAWLEADGIDLLELSGGTYENPRLLGVGDDTDASAPPRLAESTQEREAYFLAYAADMRRAVSVPMAVTGGFRSRESMEGALAAGELDVIGLARPLCLMPDLSRRLMEGELDRAPDQALRLGGGWFGPGSSSVTMRGLNSQAMTAWYYDHIIALSEGRAPDTSLTARAALWRHMRREYRLAQARRKAMR